MSFQRTVYMGIPRGFQGDVASVNPHATLVSYDGGLMAGTDGVSAGKFAWIDPEFEDNKHVINSGTGSPIGFITRDLSGVMQSYEEASMLIPEGFMVSVWLTGDFIVYLPETIASVALGDIVYVDPKTGEITDKDASGAVATKFKYLYAAKSEEAVKITSFI